MEGYRHRRDMPAFAGVLSGEEIWAVLPFIASTRNEEGKTWQPQIEAGQARGGPPASGLQV